MASPLKTKQILEGARQEFLSQGFAGATVDRIAANAGVSKATIYSHFQGKEGLFKAIVEQLAQQRFQVFEVPKEQSADPRKFLRNLSLHFLEEKSEDQEFRAFQRMLIGESERFPYISKTFIEAFIQPALQWLTTYLSENPLVVVKDPEAVARVFFGALVHFALVQELLNGKELLPLERDRLVDSLIDLIIPPGTEA